MNMNMNDKEIQAVLSKLSFMKMNRHVFTKHWTGLDDTTFRTNYSVLMQIDRLTKNLQSDIVNLEKKLTVLKKLRNEVSK